MGSVNFTDPCIYPNLKLPPKFKMSDFQKYDGKSCPMAHLRLYGVAMTQYSEDEKVLVQRFPNSLTGSALTWYTQLDLSKLKSWDDLATTFISHYKYNVDIYLDRFELQKMSKKDGESFKEYAQRWRALAVQVKPSLTDREKVLIFLSTLKKPYFDHMIGQVTAYFVTLIMIGERIEDGLKNEQLKDIEALRTMVEKQSGNIYKKIQGNGRKHEGKKESEMNFATSQATQNPPPIQYHHPNPPPPYHAYQLPPPVHAYRPRPSPPPPKCVSPAKSQSFREFETSEA